MSKIGFWSSTSLVVGNMIGSGVFLLPASLAAFGGISIIGWIASSMGALLLAIVFGRLGRLAPQTTGGPFAYTRIGLGDFPAFVVAWGYWISIWCTNAAIAVAFVGYLEVFLPILGQSRLLSIFTGLGVIWLFTWINSKPLQTVALVQLITTTLKVLPIFMVGLIGVFYINVDFFTPLNISGTSNFQAITATTTLTLFAFLGMESASIPSENTKNASSTIRLATLTGTMVAIILYIFSSIAIMGIIPPETLAVSSAPFADAAEIFWGDIAKYIIAGGALVATLGALNGWILIQGQIPMAAAHQNLFPRIFGKLNQNDSPFIGIVLSSLLASFLMMLNYSKSLVDAFTFMMKLSTLSVLTPYLFSTMSMMLIYKRQDQLTAGKIALTVLTLLFCLWVIYGCGWETVLWGMGLLILGTPFYLKFRNEKVLHRS
ncbi:amino acid permease [Portibacter marinus]|uniref:amino acid permease n=1 Tax=Portibacter marinus TaxID=2898660 RepID=UPI001F365200|nr:amino acid permease [Portibacter marinus]